MCFDRHKIYETIFPREGTFPTRDVNGKYHIIYSGDKKPNLTPILQVKNVANDLKVGLCDGLAPCNIEEPWNPNWGSILLNEQQALVLKTYHAKKHCFPSSCADLNEILLYLIRLTEISGVEGKAYLELSSMESSLYLGKLPWVWIDISWLVPWYPSKMPS